MKASNSWVVLLEIPNYTILIRHNPTHDQLWVQQSRSYIFRKVRCRFAKPYAQWNNQATQESSIGQYYTGADLMETLLYTLTAFKPTVNEKSEIF
jgi:hypothetical protein